MWKQQQTEEKKKSRKSTPVIVVWENAQNSVGSTTGDSRSDKKNKDDFGQWKKNCGGVLEQGVCAVSKWGRVEMFCVGVGFFCRV